MLMIYLKGTLKLKTYKIINGKSEIVINENS